MAEKNRTQIKADFENLDIPNENNYVDFIDSSMNRVDDEIQPSEVIAGDGTTVKAWSAALVKLAVETHANLSGVLQLGLTSLQTILGPIKFSKYFYNRAETITCAATTIFDCSLSNKFSTISPLSPILSLFLNHLKYHP